MLEIEQEALRQMYTQIIDTIMVEELLPILFQNRIIPSDDCTERIRNTGATKRDKAIKLMEIVNRCDNPDTFNIFVDALKECYGFLANAIKATVHKLRIKMRTLPRQNNVGLKVDILPKDNNKQDLFLDMNAKVEDCSITEVKKPISQCHNNLGLKSNTPPKNTNEQDVFLEFNMREECCSITEVKKDVYSRKQSRHSCPHSPLCASCRNPLKTNLSVEAGLPSICRCNTNTTCADTKRHTSPGIACTSPVPSLHEITEVKETYETVNTHLTGTLISCARNSIIRDFSVDEGSTDTFIKQRCTQTNQVTDKSNEVELDVMPKREFPDLTTTDSVDGANTNQLSCDLDENFYMKENCTKQPGHNKNLQNDTYSADDKVANWEGKKDTGYIELKEEDIKGFCPSTNQPSRVPNFKRNTASRTCWNLNTPPAVTQYSNLDNESEDNLKEITLVKKTSESFGFKFVPGFGEGRARFLGDKDYYITEIITGSIASECKDIDVLYTLKSVNGRNICDMKYDDVVRLFQDKTVKLQIKPFTDSSMDKFNT